ncbi:MAG: ankyrin repeat domain-containing protein [Roseivirga sp.]|nr:ankyrin repeat domain-containing protein [Roseivirga sp.]
MIALKMNALKTLFNIIVICTVLTGCGQSGAQTKSEAEAPKMELMAAVMAGDLAIVKQHIEAGSDLNVKEAFSGSTPLSSAATFGKTEVAKALIDAGAKLSIKNNDGATALHAAAFFGRIEIVQMLIDAKADQTVRNNFGATARESVMGSFADVKPIYDLMQQQLGPLGLKLDMEELEKSRPVIAMMLQ